MRTSGPDREPPAAPAAGAAPDHEGVVAFVRATLGCTCPDAVFEQIETARAGAERLRLGVGGRLLVYVIAGTDADDVVERLAGWVRDGVAERDRRGMNRFRLVLGAADPAAVRAVAEPRFAALTAGDDHVHLHCLHNAALRPLLAAPATVADH
jgi:hypothetical protein